MDLIQVNFKNDNLEVVTDGQAVVVKDICNSIGIDYIKQYQKIKSDPTYQSKLIKVQTNGGMQEVFCIPLSKLNGWLFSINPNRVKPQVKQKLIEYKNECFEVLYKHFNPHTANKEIEDLKRIIIEQNRLIANSVAKPNNPFAGFYENKDKSYFGKRENEWLYTRHEWMMLLNECETQLIKERGKRQRSLLLYQK